MNKQVKIKKIYHCRFSKELDAPMGETEIKDFKKPIHVHLNFHAIISARLNVFPGVFKQLTKRHFRKFHVVVVQ